MLLTPEQAREVGEALLDAAENAEDRGKSYRVTYVGKVVVATPLGDAEEYDEYIDIAVVQV
jgi:hypothetical protein